MTRDFIDYTTRGQVAYLTIDRPDALNALHPAANAELAAAFDDFNADRSLRVAILTGAGDRAFSAGVDLKATPVDDTDSWHRPLGGITSGFACSKPLIAAVNGVAAGGGFELALACDLIVAAASARFGLPEPRVGLIAGGGGIHRLARQLPSKVAMGLLLTGSFLSAEDAHRFGLVNEIVDEPGLVVPAAERWAAAILECAPTAVELTKEAVLDGVLPTLEEAIARDNRERSARLRGSGEMEEGVRAFVERRAPSWASTGHGR
jgi:enoyl-CoA hydratase/carnithine racemase